MGQVFHAISMAVQFSQVDVDRAEEATQMLTSEEGASKELMVQAQQAVAKARGAVRKRFAPCFSVDKRLEPT